MCEAVKNKILPKKVLLIGDLMIDRYTFGSVKRISPEAPIPILHREREEELLGGAGNVMSNLVGLGMKVFAFGRVGQDYAGEGCLALLQKMNVDCFGIVVDPLFETPVKSRMIAGGQQLLRIDYEKRQVLSKALEEEIIERYKELLPHMDAIAISDYDKGFCTPSLLHQVIVEAKNRQIPVIADPKGNDFAKYKQATVIKPNLSEAIRAANLSEQATLDTIAAKLLQETGCHYLMVTRSELGISIFCKQGREDFPADILAVKDVTGAGDTVCAVTAAALSNQLSIKEAAILANRAASYVVQHVGCTPITLDNF